MSSCWRLPANAADAKGGFAVEGAGRSPARPFLKAKANGGNDLAIFAGWVDGYLTGANQHAPQTYDFTPWQTVGLLIAALANHCEKGPSALHRGGTTCSRRSRPSACRTLRRP